MIAPPAVAVLAVGLGVVTAAFRLLSLVGFPNDHFVNLTRGVQMLHGGWPVRDFVDPGMPLMYVVAALGQALGGHTLLSEAVVVAAAFGIGAAITVLAVFRWTGSALLAAWAAIVEAIAFPRTYSYPKILLYALAISALLAYAARPVRTRVAALASLTAASFLFRHDHGLYIGAASLTVMCMASPGIGVPGFRGSGVPGFRGSGVRWAVRQSTAWVGVVLLLIAPYLVFVELHSGLVPYVASAMEFSRREATLSAGGWRVFTLLPAAETPAALLFVVFWAAPIVSAALVWFRRRSMDRRDRSVVVGTIVLAICVNAGFLRDPLDARVPDAIVPAVLLVSWLAHQAVEPGKYRLRPVLAAIVLALAGVTTVAAARNGRLSEQLDRAGVFEGVDGVRERTREVVSELRDPYAETQMPSDLAFALVPFYRYVQECTSPDARLFVTGFAPEVAYYARRGFAGGHVTLFSDYYSSTADQRQTIERLGGENVPFVVIPPGGIPELEVRFPLVAAFVQQRYEPFWEIAVDGQDDPAHVHVRRGLSATRRHGADGRPCFH